MARRSGRTPGELRLLLEIKRDERREFGRAHRGWFREGLHEQIEREIEEAQQHLDALARRGITAAGVPPLDSPGRVSMLALTALWDFAHNADLHAYLHERVDSLPAEQFPKLSRAQAEAKDDALAAEIENLEAELREAEYREAEAELKTTFGRA